MAGLNVALETAKRALFTQQMGVNVTGHNIANVNTPGFSRQRAVMVSNPSLNVPGGRVGTGVNVGTIERVYDRFLAAQINTQIQGKGKSEAETQILGQVQAIFNEASGVSLSQALDDFWNAWKTLSTNPSGAAKRSQVISKTTTLTQFFRDADTRLNTLRTDINHQMRGAVDQVNSLTREIAGLNVAIQQAEVGGQQPANDLRDRQQILIDHLAELIPVQMFHQTDGQVGMQLPGGKPLISGTSVWQLTATPTSSNMQVQWVDSHGTAVDIIGQLSQGKLGGFITARDTLIADYQNRLDTLAAGLISAVNEIHRSGVGLNASTDLPLFTGSTASDIALNPTIRQNPDNLAAAVLESDDTYASGDNRNALAIAALQTTPLDLAGTARTLDEYYGMLVGKIGTDTQQAEQGLAYQGAILEQLNHRRDSISGVSIDEEMTNLVKFQQMYSAAARLITRVDEMLRTVIEMV